MEIKKRCLFADTSDRTDFFRTLIVFTLYYMSEIKKQLPFLALNVETPAVVTNKKDTRHFLQMSFVKYY